MRRLPIAEVRQWVQRWAPKALTVLVLLSGQQVTELELVSRKSSKKADGVPTVMGVDRKTSPSFQLSGLYVAFP
jgi:hypothetical protein